MTSPATPRVAGKRGKLPAQFPAALRDLTYYAAGPLPAAPASVAVPNVADWGVLGNDTEGDCGPCGYIHGCMAAAAETSETEAFPTATDVVNAYLAYTGGQDSGVVLSQFLAYVKANGFCGHTVAAYAPVAVQDIPTLQFTVNAYDFAYCGITVTQEMEAEFSAGQPWDLAAAKGSPLGGHCVPVVGYDSDYLTVITWGQPQKVAYSAWQVIADEAWAVLTGEVATAGTDGHGINLAALQADLSKLDSPQPAAGPGHKSILGELGAFIHELAADAEEGAAEAYAKILGWLESRNI